MLPEWCASLAFILAAVIPFFIATRWKGGGFFVSILLGWGIINLANFTCAPPSDDDGPRIQAVFKGVWLLFGPVFMAIWATFCVCILLAFSFVIGVARSRAVGGVSEPPVST